MWSIATFDYLILINAIVIETEMLIGWYVECRVLFQLQGNNFKNCVFFVLNCIEVIITDFAGNKHELKVLKHLGDAIYFSECVSNLFQLHIWIQTIPKHYFWNVFLNVYLRNLINCEIFRVQASKFIALYKLNQLRSFLIIMVSFYDWYFRKIFSESGPFHFIAICHNLDSICILPVPSL